MKFSNVTIAGAGTLGSQIAWQTAFYGFNVTVFDAFEKGLEVGKAYHQKYAELFLKTRGASHDEIDQTISRLSYTTDLAEAVKDADIVSESIPENLEIKQSFYQELGKVAPEKTIFTTNSSTITPSEIVIAVDRPDKTSNIRVGPTQLIEYSKQSFNITSLKRLKSLILWTKTLL